MALDQQWYREVDRETLETLFRALGQMQFPWVTFEWRSKSDILNSTVKVLAFISALSRVVPGAEVSAEEITLRDPETGNWIASVALGSKALVNPSYGISSEEINGLLRGMLSAVYTFLAVLYKRDPSNRAVQELLAEITSSPVEVLFLEDVAKAVEAVLDVEAELSNDVYFEVDVPPELRQRWRTLPSATVTLELRDDGLIAEVAASKGCLSVTVKHPVSSKHFVLLSVDGEKGLGSSFNLEPVVIREGGWREKQVVIPSTSTILNDLLSFMKTGWRSIALRAIESKLAHPGAQEKLGAGAELLEFWSSLLRYGNWMKSKPSW
ncbi:MAG: hypothetical protein QXU26_03525 [Thermofilaceae archaeon]